MNEFDFKIGDKVMWNDPCIDDFDEKDRDIQLSRVFEVVDVYDDFCLISDEFGESEVPYSEIKLVN